MLEVAAADVDVDNFAVPAHHDSVSVYPPRLPDPDPVFRVDLQDNSLAGHRCV
jgi:hypothetical protein